MVGISRKVSSSLLVQDRSCFLSQFYNPQPTNCSDVASDEKPEANKTPAKISCILLRYAASDILESGRRKLHQEANSESWVCKTHRGAHDQDLDDWFQTERESRQSIKHDTISYGSRELCFDPACCL
jgi:hypothetical protein